MSHKTIITAIQLLSCKTISEDRDKEPKKLITGPPQPPNSMDQLLQYLAAINGHSNMQLADEPRCNTNAKNTKQYLE